jgi:hypothetical protein
MVEFAENLDLSATVQWLTHNWRQEELTLLPPISPVSAPCTRRALPHGIGARGSLCQANCEIPDRVER